MPTLDTALLQIRAFVLAEAETYSRLLDEAFGAGAYGASDEKRVMLEYQVAADAGLALPCCINHRMGTGRSRCATGLRSSAASASPYRRDDRA